MTEVDVIVHLLEQEEKTSGMVRDAQIEGDRRISQARTVADAEYSKRYDAELRDLEEDYADRKKQVADEFHKKSMEYRVRLDSQQQDFTRFNNYLDSLFFSLEKAGERSEECATDGRRH
jgi:vacuolar-type H+-ATPase subunit H